MSKRSASSALSAAPGAPKKKTFKLEDILEDDEDTQIITQGALFGEDTSSGAGFDFNGLLPVGINPQDGTAYHYLSIVEGTVPRPPHKIVGFGSWKDDKGVTWAVLLTDLERVVDGRDTTVMYKMFNIDQSKEWVAKSAEAKSDSKKPIFRRK